MSVLENEKALDRYSVDVYEAEDMELESSVSERNYRDQLNFGKNLKLIARLADFGYTVPILKVFREEASVHPRKEFFLRSSPHDIYEETSFDDFRKIVARLQPGEEIKFELHLDFKSIWRGLTGTEME